MRTSLAILALQDDPLDFSTVFTDSLLPRGASEVSAKLAWLKPFMYAAAASSTNWRSNMHSLIAEASHGSPHIQQEKHVVLPQLHGRLLWEVGDPCHVRQTRTAIDPPRERFAQ